MNNAAARNKTQITIGLDLGDRRHTYCVLDEVGTMAREGSLSNTREQLASMARSYPGATAVMEAGCQ
ncbi:MAG TPA: hypothetical protein VIS96_14335 [Terrimicrobiaceae bacterium]